MIFFDTETRSRVDLKKSNVYKYVTCPDFDVLMLAYAIDDHPTQLLTDPQGIRLAFQMMLESDHTLTAHNVAFDRVVMSAYLGLPEGQYLDPEMFLDTMALASEAGYPKSLGHLAVALGAEPKDEAGTRLINLFSKPNRKGQFTSPQDKPAEWAEFEAYCVQDVDTLRDVHSKLPGWPTEMERQVYLTDQRINDAGIPVDVDMAALAVATAEDNRMQDELAIMSLTGISNPGSNVQLLAWLKAQGVEVGNLQAATVQALLDLPPYREPTGREHIDFLMEVTDVVPETVGIPPTVRRVLELRQELALVAAKKYSAALDRVNTDNRLRGSFQFFGAHTGRWAGRGVQLQNLPSATLGEKDAPDHEIETAIAAGVLDLKMGMGASAHTLKALVRAMFTGPFTVVDYAAIEARVVAWLAGEQWALGAFADGRDIYVETAERMGGLTRKEGKVAVLALGYNGGVNSLRVMGAEGSDKKLQFLVTQWRDANRAIVDMWAEMNHAFTTGDCAVGEHMYVEKDGADRLIRLPSGRAVVYHDLKARWKDTPFGRRRVVSFADPKGPGIRMDTYGGKLCENVTQAVARDILAEALVRLQQRGYEVNFHVHDEIGVLGTHPIEDITRVMVEQPAWAAGLPLAAAGFQCARYRKG